MGGTDEKNNLTCLTIREHIIAHFLLWKINKNPNDLRSMNMLGARLTTEQRRTVGLFCRDNNIGFFCASSSQKEEWRAKGRETMKKNKIGIYTDDKDNRKKWTSNAGKAGAKSQKENLIGIHNPENFSKFASKGGKAMKDIVCIHKEGVKTKVYPPQLQTYLDDGWQLGWGSKRYKPKIFS
jgi:hypothetical protein